MAAAAADEVEDLTSCSIVFYPYGEEAHKPKYLSCHHTFCLDCIRTLPRARGGVFTCPKCRKKTTCSAGQVEKLATNAYAIHMITAAVNNNNPAAPQIGLENNHQGLWCTNCKKEALPSCMTLSHSTLSMGSKSAEFCQQLWQSKDVNEAKLSSIIEKRKEARAYLNEVSNAHKLVGEAIRRLEDENNVHFAQMNSLLENSVTLQPDETIQSLSLKQEETSELIKEEETDVQGLEKTYLQHINGKTKITFACLREGVKVTSNMPLYEQEAGVSNHDKMNQRKMLKAATHVLLSLLKIGDQPEPPAVAVNPPNAVVNRVPPIIPTIRYRKSIFAMTFQQSAARSTGMKNYGTVLIKPSSAFYGRPSGNFGQFDFSSSPHFPFIGTSIGAASRNSFVCLPDINRLLEALFPNPNTFLSLAVAHSRSHPYLRSSADPLDVLLVETELHFELVFLLNDLKSYRRKGKRSVRFGRIVRGEDVLEKLSRLHCDERSEFSINIEYRCTK